MADNMIIYFTGTGNSLSIARNLAQILDDRVIHMKNAMKIRSSQEAMVGLVYPCYYNDMPNAVKDFVKKFSFKDADYIYGVVNHGGDPGNSLYTFQKMLNGKGADLSYGQDVLMPVNSRIMYGRVTTDIESRVKEGKNRVKKIALDIGERKRNTDGIKKKFVASMMSNLSNTRFGKRLMTKKVDDERCIRCGTCEKVCSLNNIQMTKEEVIIGNNCTDCLACMHWCPKAAIGFGNRKVSKEQQYHHPEISLKNMILQ